MRVIYDDAELNRRTDEIVLENGRDPKAIIRAARERGIKTDSWYVAAVEMAKLELKGK